MPHIVHLTAVTRIFHKECRSLAGVGYRVSPIGHYEQPARWIKTKCPLPRRLSRENEHYAEPMVYNWRTRAQKPIQFVF